MSNVVGPQQNAAAGDPDCVIISAEEFRTASVLKLKRELHLAHLSQQEVTNRLAEAKAKLYLVCQHDFQEEVFPEYTARYCSKCQSY